MSTLGPEKWDEFFADRKWRVAEELTGDVHADGFHAGEVVQPGIRVTFRKGCFEIEAPGAFQSILSTNQGRRGVVLQETDGSGAQDIPGSRIALGYIALDKARKQYRAVW
jgi:hypothetical protein